MYKTLIYLLISVFALASCKSKYQKLLKGNDYNAKYEAAIKYYDEKKYFKAHELFESIQPIYRGTEKDEPINYYLAQCYFFDDDYIVAAYYFKTFVNTFPNSDKVEDCRYKTGYCFYMSSPKSTLDQDYSKKAIEEFQTYLNKYGTGKNIENCKTHIAELRRKLEKKAYANSKLYFDMKQYKAATYAFRNFLNDYPDSDFREESLFLLLKSSFLMAENSVDKKKFDRYESVMSDYYSYIDEYPNGEFVKEAEKCFAKSQEYISKVAQ